MSTLFSPIELRGLNLANRVMVSPMCQYSADDGSANGTGESNTPFPSGISRLRHHAREERRDYSRFSRDRPGGIAPPMKQLRLKHHRIHTRIGRNGI